MQQAVGQFPILAHIIPEIEQVIQQQQLPPERRPEFQQRLLWLVQIVKGS